jgi:hypothetical protein
MDWFDCNAGFGVPRIPPVSYAATPQDLLDEMDFCSVAEALVCHAATRDESAQAGNRLVVEGTKGQTRLHPLWAILPLQTGEIGLPEQWFATMKADAVKALVAYPEQHRYLLNGLTFGPLFEEMSDRKIPLIVGPDWRGVTSLLADFPDLTVIVVNHSGWGEDRHFRPLIERYDRFHIDTSSYDLDGGITDVVARYGPHRLLYGSGFPTMQMGGSLLTVAQADTSDDAKAAIAAGNLRRLLSEVKL